MATWNSRGLRGSTLEELINLLMHRTEGWYEGAALARSLSQQRVYMYILLLSIGL